MPDRNPNQVKFVGNLAGGEHKKQAQPKVGLGLGLRNACMA